MSDRDGPSVVAAYAIAYVWVRGTRVERRLAELCILIPFWISILTRAFGWLARPSNRGLINTWLEATGLVAEPLALAYNEFSVTWHRACPHSVRGVPARLLHAIGRRARAVGRPRPRRLAPAHLLASVPADDAPGVVGAALIVFVFTLGFFVTPAILGGGRSIMAAELVWLRMFQSPDWGLGAAISVALVALVGVLMAALFRLARPALMGGSR